MEPRRGGKRGRRKSKEFMDAALEAYVRHLALDKWREVTDLQETAGVTREQALIEAGYFQERGVYRPLWEHWWQKEVLAQATTSTLPLFGCIEAAIGGALREERETRLQCGETLLEDTLAYKAFLDRALDRLFEEEAGSLEEL